MVSSVARLAAFTGVFALVASCRAPQSAAPAPDKDTSKATSATPATPASRPPANAKPRVVFGRTVRVRFEGNRALSEAELRAVMWIDKDAGESTREPRATLESDLLFLNALYYDRGYLMINIGAPTVIEATDGPFVDVLVPILKEGPRMRVRRLTIYERDQDGQPIAALGGIDLRRLVTTLDGGWFARDVLIRDLTALRTLYRDQGYANIEAEPETEIDEPHQSLDVVIPIRRGPLVHVERIAIAGLKRLSRARIMKEVSIAEGDLFSETKLEETRKRVRALSGVRHVEISTEAGSDAAHTLITIEVEEK